MPSQDRQSTRKQTEIRVRYRTHEELVTRYTQDVSAGGVFIRTLSFLPVNTVLPLYLQLPEDPEDVEIPVIARVAHVLGADQAAGVQRSPGMGFEFLDMSREARARLEQLEAARGKGGGHFGLPGPPPEGTPEVDLHGLRVLLVEDEGLVQRRIGSLFLRQGLRLALAATGVEALSKAVQQPPDVILSDIVMPAMDGWALLRLVRARAELKKVPFLFLAGRVTERERRQAYDLGADDCIPKSTPPDEILERVVRVLGRYREAPGAVDQRRVLQGDLTHVTLPTILQMLHNERRSGRLSLRWRGCSAEVGVRGGLPVSCHIVPFDLTGREALLEVLDWDTGSFEFTPQDVPDHDDVGMSVVQLLMEHARLRDDAEAGAATGARADADADADDDR